MMKNAILPFLLLLSLVLSGCGNGEAAPKEAAEETNETITYQSESGPVEVPADP